MTTPTCPVDYTCQFTLNHPRVIVHHIGPWYHTWLFPALIALIVIVIGIVLFTMIDELGAQMRDKRQREAIEHEKELDRKHQMELAEQRTMQIDAAKGNPEMLKIIENWR